MLGVPMLVAWLYAHTRAQFHPALYALLYASFMYALMTMALLVLSLFFEALGSPGVRLDHEANAAIAGPVLFGELVRGHAKAWMDCQAEQTSLLASATGGFAAGGMFGMLMALRWGTLDALEWLLTSAGCAALYLLIAWLIDVEARKRRASQGGAVS